MIRIPKVWVVHRVVENLKPAKNFGELVFINHRYVYVDEIGNNDQLPPNFWNPLAEAARDFNPKTDYLLIVGDHLQIIILSAMLARVHKRFQVLRYDRQAAGYFPVVIDVH